MATLISLVPSPMFVEWLLEELCPEQTYGTWKLTVPLVSLKVTIAELYGHSDGSCRQKNNLKH